MAYIEDLFKPNIRNKQDKLIPHILGVLYNKGGKAYKNEVETQIYYKLYGHFQNDYFKELVSQGIPRWKHNIAWAKDRARQIYGLIESPSISGRGIWELTEYGYYVCNKYKDQINYL